MSTQFEWRTEETAGWEDLPPQDNSLPQRGWRLRRLFLLVAIVVLIAASLVIYRQFDRRVQVVAAQAEADLLASHGLLYQAAARRDAELFLHLLSGRDPGWTTTQAQLVREGAMFDRPAFGLRLLASDRPAIIDATLSPDLLAAEVTAELPYAVTLTPGVTQMVHLQHTTFYRLGPNRWLHAPPEEGFWGEWQISQAGRLTLIYPQRDAAVAARLVEDLAVILADVCRLPEPGCAANFQMQVRLSPESSDLVRVSDPVSSLVAGRNLNLPAPTLVGLPRDEAGYQALYQGYAAFVAATVLTEHSGWFCCQHQVFYRALLDRELDRLGLRSWPVTTATYARVLQQPVELRALYRLWQAGYPEVDPQDEALVYAAVEFLSQVNPDFSLAAAVDLFYSAGRYRTWLQQFAGGPRVTDLQIERAWLHYAQAQVAQAPPPIAWPAQDVLLLCGSRSDTMKLYRYDVPADTLVAEAENRTFSFIRPLSGGALLAEPVGGEVGRARVWLWQGTQQILIWDGAGGEILQSLEVDPTGSLAALALFDGRNSRQLHFLYDLAACQAGDCMVQMLEGWPTWSPQGQYTILAAEGWRQRTPAPLYLADATGRVIQTIGEGLLPFWVDEQTYGYVRPVHRVREVTIARVGDAAGTALVDQETLQADLPLAGFLGGYSIAWIATHPAAPEQLFINLMVGPGAAFNVFRVDRSTGETSLFHSGRGRAAPPVFAPDGRRLAIVGFDISTRRGHTLVYDLAQDEAHRLPLRNNWQYALDWSPDGRWLLQANGEFLTLLAPDNDYQRVTVHDLPGCGLGGWVKGS